MSWRGLSKRRTSPISVANVTATIRSSPRNVFSARTIGARDGVFGLSLIFGRQCMVDRLKVLRFELMVKRGLHARSHKHQKENAV